MLAVILLLLTGCKSLVKNALLDAESYPAIASVTQKIKKEFDVETHEFCDVELDCYNYYFAPSRAGEIKLDMNNRAHFTDKEYSTVLSVQRQDLPVFKGNVVIMHGFRASKDWALLTAAYFQFLGFDAYIFDLLGHGDLHVDKGFGVKDAKYIQRFIESELDAEDPILAVGNSMGGVVATYLVNQNVVDAAILQAPMTQFDISLQGYFVDRAPWYGFLLSNSTLMSAANEALKEVGLTVNQTNTIDMLKISNSPFLIFASNIDNVSPYSAFAKLNLDNINIIEIDQVEHAYMSMIGQFEHEQIVKWLATNTNF